MLNPQLDLLTDYPFQRLAQLLGGPVVPGDGAIVMSIGEPQHPPPPMVAQILAENAALWGRYPPADGSPEFRAAVAGWLTRRFGLPVGAVDPARHILPVAGTREALYMVASLTVTTKPNTYGPPLVLLPNPFYQVYAGAALMAGAQPVFVPGADDPAGQPDYTRLSPDILKRVSLAYLCSPANPQGSVATAALLERTLELARTYDFTLAVDECYSEIWDTTQPPGALAAAISLGEARGFDNLVVFHSLSKRSSVPGLRSGFVAGDPVLIKGFTRLRSYGGAATPMPVLAAATALWNDEDHVVASRDLYRRKLDMAQAVLGHLPGFRRPEGGFFLWLGVGDGEQAALNLWQQAKIRVLPGAYLAKDAEDGINPGHAHIRVALVHDLDTTARALEAMAKIL